MSNATGMGVAVVGCGSWGMNHLRTWDHLGHLRLACDPDPKRVAQVQSQYPALKMTQDFDAVLSEPDVRAVVIATPASTHSDLAKKALLAGKDVLVEKPMALTAADGRRIWEMADRLGLILMVGHTLAYHPAIRKLADIMAEGSLGRIQYLYSNRLNLGRIRTEENALWSFAPHDVAIILKLLGSMPEEVACHGSAFLNPDVPDVTLTDLRFAGNVRGHIFVSWLHPFKEHRFVVVGERQMGVFDDTRPWPEKLVLYPHRVEWLEGQVPVAHRAEAVEVAVKEEEPLQAECQHFVDCVTDRARPVTDGESGLEVLRVLEAAQASLDNGGSPVHLAPSDESDRPAAAYVHSSATVDPGAEIADGTSVWHYSHVMAGASVGRDCVLGQNVFVGRNVRIGNGAKIQNNVSVYEGVELEDHVFCGPSMVFTNVINPRSEIERKDELKRTLVKQGATLGANCTVLCGVTIGSHAFVGAGAVVTRDIPNYALVYGNPGRLQGWMCRCGVKLNLVDGTATCKSCSDEYAQRDGETLEIAVTEAARR